MEEDNEIKCINKTFTDQNRSDTLQTDQQHLDDTTTGQRRASEVPTFLKCPDKMRKPSINPGRDRLLSRAFSIFDGNIDDDYDDIITLNIGGIKHQTRLTTIAQFPTTKLAKLAEYALLTGKREYFFDRHPDLFPYILNFYRVGRLHVPIGLCGPLLREELDYWEIDDKDIQECCWVHYIAFEDTLDMVEKFQKDDVHPKTSATSVKPSDPCYVRYRPKIWRALQNPYSSKGATAYAVVSLLVVLLSISVFILETLPYFGALTVRATSDRSNITSAMLRQELDIFNDITPYDILLIIDNSCNVFFFTEFLIKLLTSPSKKDFLTAPLTITEAICIVPYYIAVAIVFLHPDPIHIFEFIRVLFAFRVLRIFRIFILMKHFMALKILIYTIKASTKELFLLLLVVIIGVVIFACIEYYMEIFTTDDSDFKHIPLAFWWAIITMTTVGYGDMAPKTGLGYLVGSVCAISGVLVIALSVPAIVNNFTLYYTHAQSREKLKLRKRKFHKKRWNKVMNSAVQKISEDKGHDKLPNLVSNLLAARKRSKSNSIFPVDFDSKSTEPNILLRRGTQDGSTLKNYKGAFNQNGLLCDKSSGLEEDPFESGIEDKLSSVIEENPDEQESTSSNIPNKVYPANETNSLSENQSLEKKVSETETGVHPGGDQHLSEPGDRMIELNENKTKRRHAKKTRRKSKAET